MVENKTFKVTIEKEIDEEFISDILSTAFEGGSNYWISKVIVKDGDFKGEKFASHVPVAGGTIIVVENEEGEFKEHEITKEDVIRGITKFFQEDGAFDNIDHYDAMIADEILQTAIFGEPIYG